MSSFLLKDKKEDAIGDCSKGTVSLVADAEALK